MRSARRRSPPFDDPLAEQIAWLMDGCLRIGPWSIGLDGFLGLVPGFGDVAGGAISALIIMRAMQNGVSKAAILRMVANVGIDSLLGAVPIVGDIFDFAYKSNVRNLSIYRESLSGTRQPLKDWGFILLVAAILLAFIALPILAVLYLGKLLAPHLPGF